MQLNLLLLICATTLAYGQNVTQLKREFSTAGIQAVFPGDSAYVNASQSFNRRFNYQPVAIAFPTSTEQVSAALSAGTAEDLNVVARSGGHSYVANGLGGKNESLVLDLSALTSIVYNEQDDTAVLGVGNKLGDVALGLNEHGRAMPHGRCSYVGLGGHAAFGGYGFTSRMWGLTLDAVVSIEVVLANGTIATASKLQHPDLFWALRGSGPSFGISTFLTVTTHPVPPSAIFATYLWTLDIPSGTKALSDFQTFVDSGIPPELGTQVDFFASSTQGTVQFQFIAGYFGSFESYNATVEPYLRLLPSPSQSTFYNGTWIDTLNDLSAPSLNTSAPDVPDTFYVKSVMTPEAEPMSEDAMEAFVTYLATAGVGSPVSWFVEIEAYGGSNSGINAIPLNDTSFGHRNTRFTFQLYGTSSRPPFPEAEFGYVDGMASSLIDNMPEDWDYGAYINYLDTTLENWQSLYYGDHYEELERLKAVYDPQDVFHFPTSIELEG